MKLVTTKFKSGGLHEKHVVATWNLGNYLSICFQAQGNQEKHVSWWPVAGPSEYWLLVSSQATTVKSIHQCLRSKIQLKYPTILIRHLLYEISQKHYAYSTVYFSSETDILTQWTVRRRENGTTKIQDICFWRNFGTVCIYYCTYSFLPGAQRNIKKYGLF